MSWMVVLIVKEGRGLRVRDERRGEWLYKKALRMCRLISDERGGD